MSIKTETLKRTAQAVTRKRGDQVPEKIEEKRISGRVAETKQVAEKIKKIKEQTQGPSHILQFHNMSLDMKTLDQRIKEDYIASGYKASTFTQVKVYVKPEENAAYYVVADKVFGKVSLF